MEDFEQRDNLINQIRNFHPGDRPKLYNHFGWYTGGMKDDGDWYYEVMLKSSVNDLETCLHLLREGVK